jgi:hypothetical protein
VIAVRRIDQFSPQRTDTVVATPSCCCCCCCCCCVGTLTFGGVQTEKLLTSALREAHPHMSTDEVLSTFRLQRVLAGLSPVVFTALAVGLAIVFNKNNVPMGFSGIVLALWVAAIVLLFYSANALKGAWVYMAILIAPFMLGMELAIGFVTLSFGAMLTAVVGVVLALVMASRKPKHGNAVHYFYPDGTSAPNTSTGYAIPPGYPPAPAYSPPVYNGDLQWSSPQGLPSDPAESPASWPPESPPSTPPQQPNEI